MEVLAFEDGRSASRSHFSSKSRLFSEKFDFRLTDAGGVSTVLMLSDIVRRLLRTHFVFFLIWLAATASFLETNSLRVGGVQLPLWSVRATRMEVMATTTPRATRVRALVL